MQAGSEKSGEIAQSRGGEPVGAVKEQSEELTAAPLERSDWRGVSSFAETGLEPSYLLRLFFEYPPQGFFAEYAPVIAHMPNEAQKEKELAPSGEKGVRAAERDGVFCVAARDKPAGEAIQAVRGGEAAAAEAEAQKAEAAQAKQVKQAGGLHLPLFSCRFNLLTTLEPLLLKKLQKLPFYRLLQKLLSFRALFVGSTVSEFAPLPPLSPLQAERAAEYLLKRAKARPLVIVKDLPQALHAQASHALVSARQAEAAQNFTHALQKRGFISVEGQALAYVPIDFADREAYLARFSKARRKNFRRKLRAEKALKIEVLRKGDAAFADEAQIDIYYRLYEQVYAQSAVHFDFLSKDFFRALLRRADDSLRFITYRDKSGRLIGYNICFVLGNKLVDKYIGLDYPAATDCSLYFVSWFYNLSYAKAQGLEYYIAGWTDPQVKAALGAKFVMTRHAVYIRNPLLRRLLLWLRPLFESDARHIGGNGADDSAAPPQSLKGSSYAG